MNTKEFPLVCLFIMVTFKDATQQKYWEKSFRETKNDNSKQFEYGRGL
jgi:hypothetical protein